MNHQKTALITGANKGIGFETARRLGINGFEVLLGSRDGQRGMKAQSVLKTEGLNARFLLLDVTKQDTIDAAASFIEQEYGSLDVLVNNAGISLEKGISPSRLETAVLKETFETNFFGLFAVTRAMIPLLIKSEGGRIVNVSSGLGSLERNSSPESASLLALAYNSSKTAVNAMTVQFAREFKNTPLKINSAAPGYTATDLNGFRGTRTVQQASVVIVRLATLDENGPTGGFFEDTGPVPW
ncbi:MAG: SDR family oxidoreductase [Brevinematales bacterium]|jgi:NAD(P)-dependent dehydrogenase (short-subunit alcohol dehydrogenase family)